MIKVVMEIPANGKNCEECPYKTFTESINGFFYPYCKLFLYSRQPRRLMENKKGVKRHKLCIEAEVEAKKALTQLSGNSGEVKP